MQTKYCKIASDENSIGTKQCNLTTVAVLRFFSTINTRIIATIIHLVFIDKYDKTILKCNG